MSKFPSHYINNKNTLKLVFQEIENFPDEGIDETFFFEILDKMQILEEIITNDYCLKENKLNLLEQNIILHIKQLNLQANNYNYDFENYDFEKVKKSIIKIKFLLSQLIEKL